MTGGQLQARALAGLVVSFLLVACGQSEAIGKWEKETIHSYASIEFFTDDTLTSFARSAQGTCIIDEYATQHMCKWITLDDGRLKIVLEVFGTHLYFANIEGSTLHLDEGGGATTKWIRKVRDIPQER